MIQDYTLQLDNLLQLKRSLVTLIEKLNQLDKFYANSVETCYQNGMTVQMYERIKDLNTKRVHSGFRNLANNIETIDLDWIKSLEDGLKTAINTAGANVLVTTAIASAADPGRDENQRTPAAAPGKDENQRTSAADLGKVENQRTSAADLGKVENQRNIHADYLAAFMARQKSR